ncbi:MAG: peptidase subtilisin kexin sedolisin, partial [Acidobacteria bacterium]|nr:peptidase subtilisin kexin sedolisin [Acidobacteriota bacterium]
YADMWSFDGAGWTDMKITATPGSRYGAQTEIDPRTGRTVLFGGLKVNTDTAGVQTQVYAADTWEWDGAAWKEITTAAAPPARENGRIAWDPSRRQFTLFGGWSGYLLADLWDYDGAKWNVFGEGLHRRRPAGQLPAPAPAPLLLENRQQ